MNNVNIKKQQGVVLAVCLILLLLLTVIGITGMQSTSLEEKMAGNTNNLSLSFDAAESALRVGEQFINGLTINLVGAPVCAGSCDDHIYTLGQLDPADRTVWNPAQMTELDPGTINDVDAQPMYYLEYEQFRPFSLNIGVPSIPGRASYRISAHGVGGNNLARTILQTQFIKEFN